MIGINSANESMKDVKVEGLPDSEVIKLHKLYSVVFKPSYLVVYNGMQKYLDNKWNKGNQYSDVFKELTRYRKVLDKLKNDSKITDKEQFNHFRDVASAMFFIDHKEYGRVVFENTDILAEATSAGLNKYNPDKLSVSDTRKLDDLFIKQYYNVYSPLSDYVAKNYMDHYYDDEFKDLLNKLQKKHKVPDKIFYLMLQVAKSAYYVL